MAITSFVSFLLSLLLILVQAKGRNDSTCPKSFSCGNFTDLTFPYSLPTQPDCGLLSMSGCDAKPFPRIQLVPGGELYYALEMHNSSVWIGGTKLQMTLRQHKCQAFNKNFSLPNSPFMSFHMININNFFKCISTSNNARNITQKKNTHFAGYNMYNGCEGFTIYYNLSDEYIGADNIPTNCSLIRLPIQSTHGDLFSMLGPEFLVEWKLSDECIECHYGGGQCQTDKTNKFSCHKDVIKSVGVANVSTLPVGTSKRGYLRIIWFMVATGASLFTVGLLVLLFCFRENILWYKYIRYNYTDIKRITNRFRSELGQGGFGKVYRGSLRSGSQVAVKVLNELKDSGEDFINEVASISRTSHVNIESIVSMLGPRGTIGYIAPEIVCRNLGGVSHKSDVYSYGMMVLEMVGGRKNVDEGVDRTSEIYFPHWLYQRLELDEELQLIGIMNEEEKECARKMVMVSLWCIQTDPSNRPSMSKVVEMLEGKLDSLQMPPKPYLYSPSRTEFPMVSGFDSKPNELEEIAVRFNMALASSFICFLLSLLLILVQAKGRDDSTCPKSFSCGNLTNFIFPVSLSTQPDCGIIPVFGCDAKPFPKIRLLPEGDCSSSSNNALNITQKKNTHFAGYKMYNGCEGAENLPTNCSLIRLPIHSKIGDLFDVLGPEFLVEWKLSDECNECHYGGGQCQTDKANNFSCHKDFSTSIGVANDSTLSEGTSKRGSLRIIGFMVATGASLFTIGLLVSLFCFKKEILWYKYIRFWESNAEDHQKFEKFLKNYGAHAPNRYNYTYIKRITGRFSSKLGQGGFGNVYRGSLSNGSEVAVKVLNELKGSGEDFVNEVASISRTSHVNIVSLVGFCFDGHKRALVYEFMPNGSLEKFIYEERSDSVRQLGWPILYKIALGIARGLEYLHRGCNTRILHFDIKPHNILLDEDFCPKISDFGLAKLCMKKKSIVSMLGPRVTIGYIAPEIVCRNLGGVSHKTDVYSYGMMVLEMVGGRKNVDGGVDHTSEIYFPHWLYQRLELDEELQLIGLMNEEEKECARKTVMVSLWCIQSDPSNRPSMSKIVEMLEGNLDSLQMPPKPYLYSPSRTE
ncbi:hypothetical protein KY284_022948 [Solanum tuberosum]|nr:hypothetical protein KY284_022948 [Solanum tuberosum]